MLQPKSIRIAETEETKTLKEKAFAALNDKSLSDDQADKIISECNQALLALGMPSGGLIVSRKQYSTQTI